MREPCGEYLLVHVAQPLLVERHGLEEHQPCPLPESGFPHEPPVEIERFDQRVKRVVENDQVVALAEPMDAAAALTAARGIMTAMKVAIMTAIRICIR